MTTALQTNSAHSQPSAESDARAGFRTLLSGCGIYDLRFRAKIRLSGGDRLRWLNGMVTNNIRDLAPNHGVYCFLLNAQGQIQADLYAYNMGQSLMIDTGLDQREKVLAHFDRYIISDDVEVADVSASLVAIGVAGPQAGAVLRAAGIHAPDLAALALCEPTCDCNCNCVQCTLVRGDDSEGPSYEIWFAPDKWKPTWDGLIAAGGTAVSREALELRRVRWGIPRFGIDIRERELPQETGQMRALNFTKGCYLGQEIVERIRSRGAVHRQFTAFQVEGPLPSRGTKIRAEDKEVGEITSGATLPLPGGDRAIALGYLRREAAGKNLLADGAALKPAAIPID